MLAVRDMIRVDGTTKENYDEKFEVFNLSCSAWPHSAIIILLIHHISSPSAGFQQRQQIGGRLQLSRSLFVPYRQSAVQHVAGKHPHLLCTLQLHPTSVQKKPGGWQGEMETITILTYQPLIDLEVSTPSRCVAPSTPPFRALQETAANIHSIH